MKTIVAAVTAFLAVQPALAADLAPMQAHMTRFGSDTSVLVFFVPEHDGFHVISTTQDGSGTEAKVARFVTVLGPKQSGRVSLERLAGTLVFTRSGGRLHIEEPEQIALAR